MEGTNKFNKVLLADQLTRIRLFHEGPPIEVGDFQFQYRQGSDRTRDNVTGVRWVPGEGGQVHILEKPLWELKTKDDEGNPISYKEMRNLYVAGIDSIDIGTDQTSDATRDPSKFAIVVKKRAFGT